MTLHKEAEFSRLSGGESSDGFMIGLSRENGHSDRIRRAISVVVRHVVGAEDVPGQRQPDVRTMTCETEDGLAGDAGRELGLLIPRRRRGGARSHGCQILRGLWASNAPWWRTGIRLASPAPPHRVPGGHGPLPPRLVKSCSPVKGLCAACTVKGVRSPNAGWVI